MAQDNRLIPLLVVVLIGAFAQVLFAAADCKDTPYRAAVAFSKAYFALDESMADRMCNDGVTEDEVNLVRSYLNAKYSEAASRGYRMERLKNMLSQIHTKTVATGADSAEVHLTGTIQNGINPLFWWVGKLFKLTHPSQVEETLELVKADGKWKVCGQPFTLARYAAAE